MVSVTDKVSILNLYRDILRIPLVLYKVFNDHDSMATVGYNACFFYHNTPHPYRIYR